MVVYAGDPIRASDIAQLNSMPTKMAWGSVVPTTNGSGQFTIATGLTTVTNIVCMNGDSAALGPVVIVKTSTAGGTVTLTLYYSNTGGTVNNTTFRCEYFAAGT